MSMLFAPEPLPRAERGAIYALGRHRLACSDATDKAAVAALFDGRKPTLVVTSPPYADARDYNDPILCWDSMMLGAFDGHDLADDVQLLVNLGVIHRKGEWVPYWHNAVQALRKRGWRIYGQYVWHKKRGIPGKNDGRLKSAHEFVFHFNKASLKANAFVPTKQPGRRRLGANDYAQSDGKKRKTRVPIITAATKVADSVIEAHPVNHAEASGHPAQMPVALASFLIRNWRKDGCLVYDPFGGSATTLLACEAEGVDGLACEISPQYVDLAMARWRKMHPEQRIERVS